MKNMKNILSIGLIGIGLLTACSLDEVNYSAETSSNYIQSETQYNELVNATYMKLRPLVSTTATHCMWYGTDIYSRTGEINDSQLGLDDYSYINPTDWGVYQFWCKNYDIITKANTALAYGDKLTLPDEVRVKRTAELQVLRSYAYFNLVETFGGVPLLLTQITTPQFDFERASEEEVYKQIIADLNEAIQSGGLASSMAADEFGRVDLGMAKHLLGKVLLTRSYKPYAESSDLKKAIECFETAISLHPLVDNWDILFDTQTGAYVYNNSEVIFSVRFSTNLLYNTELCSGLYQHFHPQALDKWPGHTHRGAPYWRGDLSYRASEDYMNSFEDDDIRASEKYLVRHVIAGSAGSANGHDFKAGDEIIYMPKYAMSEQEKADYQTEHPSVYLVINPDEYTKLFSVGNQNVCYPFIFKFYDPNISEYAGSIIDNQDPRGTRDVYIFRSAESKLLLAEAYLKNGQDAAALKEVNDIRKRVGATMLTQVDMDVIMDESGRELFGEANRWMDLKRCGKLFERAYKHNVYVRLHHASASDIDSYFLLRPIPQTEIDRSNNTLEQNPGYASNK